MGVLERGRGMRTMCSMICLREAERERMMGWGGFLFPGNISARGKASISKIPSYHLMIYMYSSDLKTAGRPFNSTLLQISLFSVVFPVHTPFFF